jgi:hypothetical protein
VPAAIAGLQSWGGAAEEDEEYDGPDGGGVEDDEDGAFAFGQDEGIIYQNRKNLPMVPCISFISEKRRSAIFSKRL